MSAKTPANGKGSSNSKPPPQTGIFSGIKNPQGAVIISFIGIFTAFVPVTTKLAQVNGIVERSVGLALRLIPCSSAITADRTIAGLAALYVFHAMAVTGPLSVAAQAMGSEGDFDNNTPRAHTSTLTGLPLRLYSAHQNIMENLPLWALAAGLTQIIDPTNQAALNLLGLAALTKMFVYYPAYIFDVAPLRSISHVIHTSATVNVLWKLATNFKSTW